MTVSCTGITIRTACLLAALALVAGGCGSAPVTGVPADATAVPDGRMELLLQESQTGLGERTRRVIRAPAVWADAWKEVHDDRTPVPERPAVDFDSAMVILAAMGSRPTGGYGVEVESVYRDGETLYVVVVEASPGDGCVVPQALTAPATAVRVPRASGDVHFVEKETVNECS